MHGQKEQLDLNRHDGTMMLLVVLVKSRKYGKIWKRTSLESP